MFPHADSVLRLAGALLAPHDDESPTGRRYFSVEPQIRIPSAAPPSLEPGDHLEEAIPRPPPSPERPFPTQDPPQFSTTLTNATLPSHQRQFRRGGAHGSSYDSCQPFGESIMPPRLDAPSVNLCRLPTMRGMGCLPFDATTARSPGSGAAVGAVEGDAWTLAGSRWLAIDGTRGRRRMVPQ